MQALHSASNSNIVQKFSIIKRKISNLGFWVDKLIRHYLLFMVMFLHAQCQGADYELTGTQLLNNCRTIPIPIPTQWKTSIFHTFMDAYEVYWVPKERRCEKLKFSIEWECNHAVHPLTLFWNDQKYCLTLIRLFILRWHIRPAYRPSDIVVLAHYYINVYFLMQKCVFLAAGSLSFSRGRFCLSFPSLLSSLQPGWINLVPDITTKSFDCTCAVLNFF